MRTRAHSLAALAAAALLPGCVAFTTRHDWSTAQRQPCEPRLSALTPAEAQAVAACLTRVRACQLPDGAFAMVRPGEAPDARAWVAPYFGHFAALALLAGHAHSPSTNDLARVRRWLDWCSARQSAEGCWHDFEGPAARLADTGRVDAWDSSAALYLLAAARFRREGGMTSFEIFAAARKALACLAALADADGLTWAKPDCRVKYLMDNVESLAGLCAAAQLFETAHYADEARQARGLASRLAPRLAGFRRPPEGLFAYALHAGGTFAGGLDKPYPHGLAQLYGVAFVATNAPAWEAACRAFRPETGPSAACGAEWWLAAASRLGERDARAWRDRVVAETAAFSPDRTYLHRYALSALTLLEGASWLTAEEAPHANSASAASARAAGAR